MNLESRHGELKGEFVKEEGAHVWYEYACCSLALAWCLEWCCIFALTPFILLPPNKTLY